MLLSHSRPVERRCPRLWTLFVGGSLLALAFLMGGVNLAAQEVERIIIIVPAPAPAPAHTVAPGEPFEIRLAAPKDGKDVLFLRTKLPGVPAAAAKPTKDGKNVIILRTPVVPPVPAPATKKVAARAVPLGGGKPGEIELEVVFPPDKKAVEPKLALPPAAPTFGVIATDPVDVDRLRTLIEKLKTHPDAATQKELIDLIEKIRTPAVRVRLHAGDPLERLGLKVARPADLLIEHLNLKKGQGLLITEVAAGSVAAKAGLRANDIILKAAGKDVPGDVAVLTKLLQDHRAGAECEFIVVRRGKQETIRGVVLPDLAGGPGDRFWTIRAPRAPLPLPAPPGGGVMTTTFRNEDRFTTRHQEGSLVITVTGKIADGKAQATEITVQDGAVVNRYERVDAVPAAHADKVRHLIAISGGLRVER